MLNLSKCVSYYIRYYIVRSVLLHSSITSNAHALLIASDNSQVLQNIQKKINNLPLFNVISSVTLTSWKKLKNIDLILLQARDDKYYNVFRAISWDISCPTEWTKTSSFCSFFSWIFLQVLQSVHHSRSHGCSLQETDVCQRYVWSSLLMLFF